MDNLSVAEKKKNEIYYKEPKYTPLYLGIFIGESECTIAAFYRRNKAKKPAHIFSVKSDIKNIVAGIHKHAEEKNAKFIAAGIMNENKNISKETMRELFSELWLEEDIVPFAFKENGASAKATATKLAKKAQKQFIQDNIVDIRFDKQRRVICPHLVRPSDYKNTVRAEEYEKLLKVAEELKASGEKIAFFSSTPRGGGVALMRHALMRILEQLEVDAGWYVLENSNTEIFNITKKKFHNILQGVAPPGEVLSEKEKEVFGEWSKENAEFFEPVFKEVTTIIIDDPQPSGMIPYIKEINPKAKIIYRSHIQIDTSLLKDPESSQTNTWNFIWENVKLADVFVSHPIEEFVPPKVIEAGKNVVYMPATTDELDGLNKPLSESQLEYYFSIFNTHLKETDQEPLDMDRDYVAQIARFDPSKGIPDVLVSYRTLREKLEEAGVPEKKAPQLIIAGHGSIDDPEGIPLLEETLHKLDMDVNKKYAKDIKVTQLPHIDQLLDALLSKSKVILQLSHKEGFEIKVSEALAKGKPVIAYKTGGIPLQIEDGVTGHLVPVGNTSEVAQHMYDLFTDEKLYAEMSHNAETKVKRKYFTVGNTTRWMELVLSLRNK